MEKCSKVSRSILDFWLHLFRDAASSREGSRFRCLPLAAISQIMLNYLSLSLTISNANRVNALWGANVKKKKLPPISHLAMDLLDKRRIAAIGRSKQHGGE